MTISKFLYFSKSVCSGRNRWYFLLHILRFQNNSLIFSVLLVIAVISVIDWMYITTVLKTVDVCYEFFHNIHYSFLLTWKCHWKRNFQSSRMNWCYFVFEWFSCNKKFFILVFNEKVNIKRDFTWNMSRYLLSDKVWMLHFYSTE